MKKFEKIFFSMIAMIMMVAVGSVFTSCTNDDDDFPVTAHETQLDQALDQDTVASMTRSTLSSGSVSTTYKYRYYTAYKRASNNFSSAAQNWPIALVFYTVYDATFDAYYKYNYNSMQDSRLDEFCNHSTFSGSTLFRSFSTLSSFKGTISRYITNTEKPAAITIKDIYGNYNGLIVWDYTSTGVTVTKISITPTTIYTNNTFISLTWSDLYSKALAASNIGVANVAFMTNNTDDLDL